MDRSNREFRLRKPKSAPDEVFGTHRHGIWISVPLALAVWFVAALVFGPVHWAAWAALVLNLVIFVLCFFIVERYGHVRMPPTKRTWYDFMIRASMVALLVGAVLTLSFRIGPAGSGILAVFPVIYTSIMVTLHRRVGGPATAAVLANAIPGLAGFGMALLTSHLTAVPLGSASALLIALFVSVAWNLMLYLLQRQQLHT